MFELVVVAAIAYGIFVYRKSLIKITHILWNMSLLSKFVGILFLLGITPLFFFQDRLAADMIFFARIYALGLLGHQLYRILRIRGKAGFYFPPPTYWTLPCIILVMMTPLCDLILGREYPNQTNVLVGATSVSYVCLYLIEIYIRYPNLGRNQIKKLPPLT